jgi:hypothetical protein
LYFILCILSSVHNFFSSLYLKTQLLQLLNFKDAGCQMRRKWKRDLQVRH